MLNLKQNNERLQRLVTSRSLAGSQSSLGTGGSAVEDPRRFSLADQSTMHQVCISTLHYLTTMLYIIGLIEKLLELLWQRKLMKLILTIFKMQSRVLVSVSNLNKKTVATCFNYYNTSF